MSASQRSAICLEEEEEVDPVEEPVAEPIRAHRIEPQTLFAPTCPCLAAHCTRHLPRGEENNPSVRRSGGVVAQPVHLWSV